jgi:hypothetical protein
VSCPGLPGCWSQGETEKEAIDNIREAIKEYLAAVDDLAPDADMREVDVAVWHSSTNEAIEKVVESVHPSSRKPGCEPKVSGRTESLDQGAALFRQPFAG